VLAEADAATEEGRLALLERRFDPGTIRRLGNLGVTSGWRCLEVGAGHGSVARWLPAQVGLAGSVVAADIDTHFLTGMPHNVDVRELDMRDPVLEPDFDRGVLLAEEGDFGLLHLGGHPNSAAQNDAHQQMLTVMRYARIMHAYFGRRLPAMMLAHGLDVQFIDMTRRPRGSVSPSTSGCGRPCSKLRPSWSRRR
jgi:hypothetical protein